MTDHQLRLTGHPVYDWTLECTHEVGAPGWRTCDETGECVSDECWLPSWWDECGMEMVTDDDRHGKWPIPTGPTIPVAVLEGTEDEPLLVPAREAPVTDHPIPDDLADKLARWFMDSTGQLQGGE